jgi:xylulokinase
MLSAARLSLPMMIAFAETAPPGAEGLFFSPHLGGRICPATPEMRGAWLGFSWGHTQAHFARAVLEGVAYEYAYYLRILRELIPDLELVETRAVGGGAKSPVWNQIKANVLGVPYQSLKGSEFSSWACAMIAGKAAGLFDDLAAVAETHAIPAGAQLEPDPAMHTLYRPLIQEYIEWQGFLSDSFVTLAKETP